MLYNPIIRTHVVSGLGGRSMSDDEVGGVSQPKAKIFKVAIAKMSNALALN